MASVVEKLLEYLRMSEETSDETKQEDLPEGMPTVEAYLAHKCKMEEETEQKN